MLINEGALTFERDGRRMTALAGDALPIGHNGRGVLRSYAVQPGRAWVVSIRTFDEGAIAKQLRENGRLESTAISEEKSRRERSRLQVLRSVSKRILNGKSRDRPISIINQLSAQRASTRIPGGGAGNLLFAAVEALPFSRTT